MSKRYVYWRMPTGKPYKGDDGRFAPSSILETIGAEAKFNVQGNITWRWSFLLPTMKLAVRNASLVLDPTGREVNDADSWSIVWKAMVSIIKKQGGQKALRPQDVLREADRQASEFYLKPFTDYDLVTSLSVAELPAERISLQGCVISAVKQREKRFPYPEAVRRQALQTAFESHLTSTKYSPVRIRTKGRSVHEAMHNASRALNLLRGLWTFFSTYGQWSMTLGGLRQHVLGIIHVGPIHTLHHPDGASVDNLWWFEPGFTGDQKLFTPKNSWHSLERKRKWAIRQMAKLPTGKDIEELIVRYVLALDQTDLDVAFLFLWSILERLTDTIGKSYDDTIRRIVRVYEDRDSAKEMLEGLRSQRNKLVMSSVDSEQVAYMIKSFVDPHLLRLLRNDFKVQSLQEYAEFLNLPVDVEILKRKRRHISKALGINRRGKGPE